MLEGAGRDAAGLDERIDVVLLEADDATEAVAGDLALIDEAVQRAGVMPRNLAASAVLSQWIGVDMGRSLAAVVLFDASP